MPVKFRVGVGHPYRLSPELKGWASVSAEHLSDNSSVSGGVELRYREMLSMRPATRTCGHDLRRACSRRRPQRQASTTAYRTTTPTRDFAARKRPPDHGRLGVLGSTGSSTPDRLRGVRSCEHSV